MNPVELGLRSVDAWQQRHPIPGFLFAVYKKFSDDQAGNLVALLTYFAFIATFPLLLALTGILGLVLKGDPALQVRIQSSALSEFPIIGTQINSQIGVASLGHSAPILIFSILGAIFGGRGLANTLQNTLNSVWNVPKVIRPGFPSNFLRTVGLLALSGVAVITSVLAASLATAGEVVGLSGIPIKILGFVLTTAFDIVLFFAAFRMATAKIVAAKDLLLGAVLSSIAWQILAGIAGVLIARDLKNAQALAGFFGVILGLLAWFGLQAAVTVYAMEVDVVRARHLWPRSVTQPPLTDADKRYIEDVTRSEVRRPEQKVTIEFSPEADRDPRHPPKASTEAD